MTIQMKRILSFLLTFFLLGVVYIHAQEVLVKAGIGGVLPVRRSYVEFELAKQISPNYLIGLSSETSATEHNLSVKLKYNIYKHLWADTGFGWGHIWRKNGIDDHNFHTYIVGIQWRKPIGKRTTLTFGTSIFGRSYQAHIGFHKGTLRVCSGIVYNIKYKNKKRQDEKLF